MRKEGDSCCRAGRGVFRGSKTRVPKAPGVRHGVGVGLWLPCPVLGLWTSVFYFPVSGTHLWLCFEGWARAGPNHLPWRLSTPVPHTGITVVLWGPS